MSRYLLTHLYQKTATM